MQRVFRTLGDQVPNLIGLAGFGKTMKQIQSLAALMGQLDTLRSESSFKTANEMLLAMTMLAEHHARLYDEDSCSSSSETGVVIDDMERIRRCCGYSFSSYSMDLIRNICAFDASNEADVNILQSHPKSSHGMPAHFIIERRKNEEKEILIVVRGTMELGDAISSTLCASEILLEGKCHGGISDAAHYLFDKHRHLIRICSEAGYKIQLCGHSYGGGAASVLGIMLRDVIPNADIHTYGFATPAVMSEELVRHSQSIVTTVVNGYDCIPRASVANARKLLEELHTFDWRSKYERRVDQICGMTEPFTSRIGATKPIVETVRSRLLSLSEENDVESSSSSMLKVEQKIDLDVELYPPGQCIQLHSNRKPQYANATQDFDSLILAPTCVSDHRVASYVNQIGEPWGNFDTNALKKRRTKKTREALDNIFHGRSVWFREEDTAL